MWMPWTRPWPRLRELQVSEGSLKHSFTENAVSETVFSTDLINSIIRILSYGVYLDIVRLSLLLSSSILTFLSSHLLFSDLSVWYIPMSLFVFIYFSLHLNVLSSSSRCLWSTYPCFGVFYLSHRHFLWSICLCLADFIFPIVVLYLSFSALPHFIYFYQHFLCALGWSPLAIITK